MSNVINRRSFQSLLICLVGAGLLPTAPAASDAPASKAAKGYLSKVRFLRRGNTFHVWIRAKELANPDVDVPVTITLATDAESRQVVSKSELLAKASQSHIVRGHFFLPEKTLSPGAQLYGQLLLGDNTSPIRLWKLKAASV